MFSYKLQVVEQLEDGSFKAPAVVAQWRLPTIQGDASFRFWVSYFDECMFHVDGKVSQHNPKIWGTEKSHETRRVGTDSERVAVWCAISVNQVFGLYSLNSTTVIERSYRQLLTNYFLLMLPSLPPNAILRHKGAPLHYSLEVRKLLDEELPDSWTGKEGSTCWPGHSSVLNNLDFFL